MTQADKNTDLIVYYDGGCTLCTREIAFYQKREGAEKVDWVDVNAMPEGSVAPDLSKDQAMARFHVRTPDGKLHSGGPAFARLWTMFPGFRTIGSMFTNRPLGWVLDRFYDVSLVIRPYLQRMVRKDASKT